MPPAKKKPTPKVKRTVAFDDFSNLNTILAAHISADEVRHQIVHDKIGELQVANKELVDEVKKLIDHVNKPMMVTVTNGTTHEKPIQEVLSYIWEYTYLTREGNQLKNIFKRNKQLLKSTGKVLLTAAAFFSVAFLGKDVTSTLSLLIESLFK